MKSHSQFGEDAWLILNPPFDLETGTFCEVGAFDGVQSSNTLLFEELFGWNGMCVEADPKLSLQCMSNRRLGIACPCFVVTNKNGPVMFHLHRFDPGQSGLLAEGDPLPHFGIRLDKLLEIFHFQDLTLLSIDTEGTELDVWDGLGTIRPRIVIIEYLSGDQVDRSKEIMERLTRDGYKQVHRTEANLIFVKV